MNGYRCLTFAVAFQVSATAAFAGCMDTDNKLWLPAAGTNATYRQLMELMACPADVNRDEGRQIDAVACNWFVAKAVSTLYDVEEFGPKVNGKWLTANEIVQRVRSHRDKWTMLGNANVQSTLNDAAADAGNKQPVIAGLEGDPHGHVALILAGSPQVSTTWKNAQGTPLKVPNSAAFSLNNVSKAYVFCRLSAGFADPTKVEIYFRKK